MSTTDGLIAVAMAWAWSAGRPPAEEATPPLPLALPDDGAGKKVGIRWTVVWRVTSWPPMVSPMRAATRIATRTTVRGRVWLGGRGGGPQPGCGAGLHEP
jgi:hypothetical protein